MADRPRICPDCGSDTYFADNFERIRDQNSRLREEYERQAAKHAVERAQWEMQRFEVEEQRRTMQAKTQRQRKVINRLEKRLRQLAIQPYAEEPAERCVMTDPRELLDQYRNGFAKRARAALRAVLDMHHDCQSCQAGTHCFECGEREPWPCPTVQAITAALEKP